MTPIQFFTPLVILWLAIIGYAVHLLRVRP